MVSSFQSTLSLVAALAVLLGSIACTDVSPVPASGDGGGSSDGSHRLELLRQAFTVLPEDPVAAARVLEQAGPGSVLEQVRLEVWLYSLGRSHAGSDQWRRLSEHPLPAELRRPTLLGLGRALLEEGDDAAAVTVLERVGGPEADELLLGCSDQEGRRRAAQRLALSAPHRLRRSAPALEGAILAGMDSDGWLERAAAWRRAGSTGQAIAELGRQRWRGPAEHRRKLELARAYTERGSPLRALSLLPTDTSGAGLVVRALAHRTRAWQRFPRSEAQVSFRSCLSAARQAVVALGDQDEAAIQQRHEALRLVVECGTETADTAQALAAWWQLAAAGWQHPQRQWLGRRLGVAASLQAETVAQVPVLASGLPDHERCLRYWAAVGSGTHRRVLVDLARDDLGDLYSQWARQELGWEQPLHLELPAAVGMSQPPQTVRWLHAWGAPIQASLQWRRLRAVRGASLAEALAAATFEDDRGRPDLAIRWLRAVCPELGTVAMGRLPEDLLRAYLPLRWVSDLKAAARESGLPPWMIAGLARQESIFGARARSPRGAIGVLQLIPSTARMHSRALGIGSNPDLTNPAVNLRLGARELARVVRGFGAVEPALAAYNAGEARVRRWWRQWPERHRFTEAIPIDETYTYVRRVVFLAEAYRLVYRDLWTE